MGMYIQIMICGFISSFLHLLHYFAPKKTEFAKNPVCFVRQTLEGKDNKKKCAAKSAITGKQ